MGRREDYEHYLERCRARRRLANEERAAGADEGAGRDASDERRAPRTLGIEEFEQALRRFDRLSLRELEAPLSPEDARLLNDLAERLELKVEFDFAAAIDEEADDETVGCGNYTVDGVHEDDDFAAWMNSDTQVTAVDPACPTRQSRLGSLRPDARNRRSLWRQQRRNSRN